MSQYERDQRLQIAATIAGRVLAEAILVVKDPPTFQYASDDLYTYIAETSLKQADALLSMEQAL